LNFKVIDLKGKYLCGGDFDSSYGNMFERMIQVEKRGVPSTVAATNVQQWAVVRVIGLFMIVVAGILASWVWEILWKWVKYPEQPITVSIGLVLARVILAFIAGGVTFRQMYLMIDQPSNQNRVQYLAAFENGFLWDSIFKTVTGQVTEIPAA